MPDRNDTLRAAGARTPGTKGDLPEGLRRRYYTEDRAREVRVYVDAQSKTPVFLDRGRRLVAPHLDPNAIRDMAAIAQHRGWRIIEVSGTPGFRREAWMAGRTLGLEVKGYAPTERDLQELDRRRSNRERMEVHLADLARPPVGREDRLDRAADRLRTVEAVVKSRIGEPAIQDRLMARARERIADWLERGAEFTRPAPTLHRKTETIERRRTR